MQNGYAGIGQRGEDTALAAGNSSGGPVGGNTTIRGPATEGDYPDISGASGSIGMAGIDVPPDLSWSGYGNTGQKGAAFAPAPQGQEPTGR
ncbi:MAG: hypothetical protein IRZ16_01320 [Myxococcaceae bacterium]|nr:hypothetical protein [Myxococcaceae bacterium]